MTTPIVIQEQHEIAVAKLHKLLMMSTIIDDILKYMSTSD